MIECASETNIFILHTHVKSTHIHYIYTCRSAYHAYRNTCTNYTETTESRRWKKKLTCWTNWLRRDHMHVFVYSYMYMCVTALLVWEKKNAFKRRRRIETTKILRETIIWLAQVSGDLPAARACVASSLRTVHNMIPARPERDGILLLCVLYINIVLLMYTQISI